jgi:hypothetical protein
MDRSQAQEFYVIAQQCYQEGRYDEALEHLRTLDAHFPDNHRVLRAQARTLAKMGRREEALSICEHLLEEFQYEKIRAFRDHLAAGITSDPAELARDSGPQRILTEPEVEAIPSEPERKRFRIKPIRLALLLLIVAGMYFQYVPYWLGGGLIAGYFIIKFAIGRLFVKLFSIPFKMKGKPLDGADVTYHGHAWTAAPKKSEGEDDEEDTKPKKPLRYAWLDITITPKPRTQGFTHWEPGEIMVAPKSVKVRGLDDMDKCYGIHEVRIIEDGKEMQDEGYKLAGPRRIRCLVGVPEGETDFRFFYYGYAFGNVKLL